MTQTVAPATTPPRTVPLARLHVIRAAVSAVWVGLLLATWSDLTAASTATTAAGILLVAYPLWDAGATVLEGRRDRLASVNTALGLLAGAATLVAVQSTIGDALIVFGTWASVSGAIQLAVALRRRTAGGQWPMIVSGGLSVLAGASFAAMSQTDTSRLTGLAGYSAFGAFWFLVSAAMLRRRATLG